MKQRIDTNSNFCDPPGMPITGINEPPPPLAKGPTGKTLIDYYDAKLGDNAITTVPNELLRRLKEQYQ